MPRVNKRVQVAPHGAFSSENAPASSLLVVPGLLGGPLCQWVIVTVLG